MNSGIDLFANDEEFVDAPLKIIGFIDLVDEEDVEIEFAVFNCRKKKMVNFAIKRTELSPAKLEYHIKKNWGIGCSNYRKLCELVELYENFLLKNLEYNKELVRQCHEALGWKINEEKVEFDADAIYKKSEIVQSEYRGHFDIKPKGSLENIKEMVCSCILGNTPMLAIMVMGAASISLGFSNMVWKTNIYNIIFHLLSNSSRGKSTAADLIASFTGNPEGSNSFKLTYLATENAILKRIGNAHGIPFAIDEHSATISKREWSDFIYILANGYDKDRCSAGGARLQETARFQGIFVSNGEKSLMKKCNGNEGIRARLFEIFLENFTRSSEESDIIKQTVSSNYGILTPLIAQELMRNSDHWNSRRLHWKEETKKRIKDESIVLNTAMRITEYVALLTMSCELLEVVLGIELDVKAVFDFFFLHLIFKNAEEANIGNRVYDYLIKFISDNRGHLYEIFGMNGAQELDEGHIGYHFDNSMCSRPHKVNDKIYSSLYIFPVDTIDKALAERGFEDTKVAMRELRQKKLLKNHGDRPTWEFPINGIKTKVYAIWAEKQEDLIWEYTEAIENEE